MASRVRKHAALREQKGENQKESMQSAAHWGNCNEYCQKHLLPNPAPASPYLTVGRGLKQAHGACRCSHAKFHDISLRPPLQMPELPEVETTRAGLAPRLRGRRLLQVIVRNPRLRWPIPGELGAMLAGKALHSINRRGKYLLFDFGGVFQIVHLGMSGSLRFVAADEPASAHDHVDWVFDQNTVLRLRDPRRFGAVLLCDDPATHPLLASLGPEPLTDDFDGNTLYTASRGRKVAVKNFIMDSHVVVGVGNIYASESLFRAGIRPGRAAGRLTRPDCERLAAAIKTTLQNAVSAGGSSLRDYVSTSGELGYFQLQTQVYDRAGLPCKICGTLIKKQTTGQRSTFYCPQCQK